MVFNVLFWVFELAIPFFSALVPGDQGNTGFCWPFLVTGVWGPAPDPGRVAPRRDTQVRRPVVLSNRLLRVGGLLLLVRRSDALPAEPIRRCHRTVRAHWDGSPHPLPRHARLLLHCQRATRSSLRREFGFVDKVF